MVSTCRIKTQCGQMCKSWILADNSPLFLTSTQPLQSQQALSRLRRFKITEGIALSARILDSGQIVRRIQMFFGPEQLLFKYFVPGLSAMSFFTVPSGLLSHILFL